MSFFLQRILDVVEEVAVSAHDKAAPGEEYKVRNAKPKTATNNTNLPLDYLTENSHFYNTPVNISYSSVHVPTYVYDRGKSTMFRILYYFIALNKFELINS